METNNKLYKQKWYSAIYVFMILFLSFCVNSLYAEEYIRICSFNIAEFGEGNHPKTRNIDSIAKMITDEKIDLLVIEEVGTKLEAEKQVEKLCEIMNTLTFGTESKYYPFITPQSGDERCAVIFRDPIIMEDDIMWLDEDLDPSNVRLGGQTYYRIPVALGFRAGNFDFFIVILHLSWSDLERRKGEFEGLKSFLEDGSDTEKDWIIMGDTNRYGKYSKNAAKSFDVLLSGNWKDVYRFPLLEAITEPDDMNVYRASEDKYSTTISKNKDIYDQFIITKGAEKEFDTNNPKFGEDVGIIAFDMDHAYDSMAHNEIKYMISDHRPIWIQFRTDLADDD